MNIVVILSGGVGKRFASNVPKQYTKVCNKEIISFAIDAAKKSALCNDFFVVAQEEWISSTQENHNIKCVLGGSTHNESVQNALDYISLNYENCENVVFLDSVRPFITADIIDEHFNLLKDHDAVITTQKITDSLGSNEVSFVDREDYYLIQKPESFKFKQLYECFSESSNKTAIVQQLPNEVSINKFYGLVDNIKVTYPTDVALVEYLINHKQKGGK